MYSSVFTTILIPMLGVKGSVASPENSLTDFNEFVFISSNNSRSISGLIRELKRNILDKITASSVKHDTKKRLSLIFILNIRSLSLLLLNKQFHIPTSLLFEFSNDKSNQNTLPYSFFTFLT